VFGQILVEFIFRLTFGVAAAMGLTRSDQVTGGFYRVHLWVLLGLQTLAALALYSRPATSATHVPFSHWQLGCSLAAAILCYVGAALWMYDQRRAGMTMLWIVAALALAGCLLPIIELVLYPQYVSPAKRMLWQVADRITGGLLLGLVTTAMLLGHWYLNTPTMKLEPLRRLIWLLAAAVVARALVCGAGAGLNLSDQAALRGSLQTTWLVFLALRWLAGIVSVLSMAWLTWQTLKIPNTQSATGILYAGVILAFIGELTSQLLSAEARYPL
jgi:hypothetical protein